MSAPTLMSPPKSDSKEDKKEKKHNDKDLDLQNANRGVWLVKVPKYIAERWEAGGRKETKDVGKLKITRKPNQKPVVSFSLADELTVAMPNNDEIEQKTAIPKEHTFMVSANSIQTLAVFSVAGSVAAAGDPDPSETPVPDKLSLEGKIVQRAECRPINDKTYMNLKMDSIKRAIQPKKTTITLKAPVNAYKPIANHVANVQYEKNKKLEGKKSRDDKDHVMEMLFALFEKHQYYKINDLVKATKQPVPYLKQILNEICEYNMKNPHRNMWELKAEYRHYKKTEEEKVEEKDDNMDSDDSD